MSEATFEAATVEAALEQAAAKIGGAPEELEYEIVEEKQDFWGLSEGSVIIRAWSRPAAAEEPSVAAEESSASADEPSATAEESRATADEARATAEEPRTGGDVTATGEEPGDERSDEGEVVDREAAEPTERRASEGETAEAADDDAEPRDAGRGPASEADAPETEFDREHRADTTDAHNLRDERRRQQREAERGASRDADRSAGAAEPEAREPEPDDAAAAMRGAAEDRRDTMADRAEAPSTEGALVDEQAAMVGLLEQMFHDMDFECTVEIQEQEGGFLAAVAGADKDLLLEGNGRCLSALELILNNAFRHKLPKGRKVRVDAGDFRSRREEELTDLAYQVAHSAKEARRTQETQPLNPYERRLVHLALADDPSVTTRSRGSGFLKNVQVIPRRGGRTRRRR